MNDVATLDLEQLVRRLVKTAAQVLDPTMRKHFLVRKFRELDDEQIAEAIHRIQVRALQGDGPAGAVVAGGLDAAVMLRELGKVRVGRIFHEASRRDYQTVCNLFRSLKPAKSPKGDEDAFLKYGLPDLTIGERKVAARSFEPDRLNRVGFDSDPLVIRQLLKNPRLVEKMVVDVAARRPNYPAVLEEIYRAVKWRSRPEVRVALVRNPYTAPQIAMALVPMLKRRELLDVVNDGGVHAEVCQAAETALAAKARAGYDTAEEDAAEENADAAPEAPPETTP